MATLLLGSPPQQGVGVRLERVEVSRLDVEIEIATTNISLVYNDTMSNHFSKIRDNNNSGDLAKLGGILMHFYVKS